MQKAFVFLTFMLVGLPSFAEEPSIKKAQEACALASANAAEGNAEGLSNLIALCNRADSASCAGAVLRMGTGMTGLLALAAAGQFSYLVHFT